MDVDLSVPILLDGAIATNLFSGEKPEGFCIEEWILDHPEKLLELQREFVEMGSRILYTPTLGANESRLKEFGLEDKMEEYNRRLTELTRQAAGGKAKVAGAMSSTGLLLEPFGDTSFTEMIHIYRQQAAVLLESGVDLLVVESLTSISEARAAAIALKKLGKPFMITLSLDEDGETPIGGTAMNALVILQELGVSAFGLNCSYGAENIANIIEQLKPYAKIPLIAKPSAYGYDEESETTYPLTPIEMAMEMKQVLAAGASLVGGCCGTTPAHLEAIGVAIEEYKSQGYKAERGEEESQEAEIGDIVLADIRQFYHLYCDQIECTEPLECSVDMTDDLLEAESGSEDVILIEINTVDDARDFAANAHIATLPVCFYSHDETALRLALLLYNGRAMVDSRSSIDEETLQKIADKYGAVIY